MTSRSCIRDAPLGSLLNERLFLLCSHNSLFPIARTLTHSRVLIEFPKRTHTEHVTYYADQRVNTRLPCPYPVKTAHETIGTAPLRSSCLARDVSPRFIMQQITFRSLGSLAGLPHSIWWRVPCAACLPLGTRVLQANPVHGFIIRVWR